MENTEKRIINILKSINEDICSFKGNNLLEEKVIDSFEVMEIIAALEDEFNIEIDPDYVIVENFANIQSIIDMIKKCLGA